MPVVVFMSSGSARARPPEELLRVDAPDGGSLADLCDDVAAPVAFSCRSASCGTCRVAVLEGGDLLLPPQDDELELLAIFGASASSSSVPPAPQRLACQVHMHRGPGCIIIRPVDDEP